LHYDFEVFGDERSITELMVKVFAQKEADIKIAERIHLDGREAKGVVMGETYGNAPFARGHIDCLEIVNGEGAIARAIPMVDVKNEQAKVTHEAAIGSIDKKQLQTLMAHGLSEEQAVDVIVKAILG
jgi:hypothetical protein